MNVIKLAGRFDFGARLFVAGSDNITGPESLNGVRNASCLLAMESEVPLTDTDKQIMAMLDVGARWFCIWGPGASKIHIHIDHLIILSGKEEGGRTPLTVGEDGESLEEMAEFFANTAGRFNEGTEFDYLIVVWGGDVFGERITNAVIRALWNPEEFAGGGVDGSQDRRESGAQRVT